MNILALDPSLTRTGWAHNIASPRPHGVFVPPKGSDRGVARLEWFHIELTAFAVGRFDLAVIEGYSFGSKGSAVFSLGELGGVLRLSLRLLRIPYVEIAPGTLKRYATGSGAAKKNEVLAAAIRRLGYPGADDNEADALWLLQMALAHYGLPAAVQMPAAHREALAKIDWPELAAGRTAA